MNEFELIEQLFAKRAAPSTKLGIGDDCAVISSNKLQTVCTDTLVRGVHYPIKDVDYHAIGYKSIAVNVSDTVAMSSLPKWATLSLSAKDDFDFRAFSKGFEQALDEYGIDLIGGDTTSGAEVVGVTLIGECERIVKRQGAQSGDAIVLTGELGFAAAALAAIQTGQVLSDKLYQSYWRPKIDLHWRCWIEDYASACIDISDGLLQDLSHILKASGDLGAQLDKNTFSELSKLEKLKFDSRFDPLDWILRGGDDYKMCFCVHQEKMPEMQKLVQSHNDLRIIGKVTDHAGIFLDDIPQSATGYRHF